MPAAGGESQTSPFSGLRVVEYGSEPAAESVGRLMAELGAEVIKVEPPGGAPSRAVGPWLENVPGPERSLNFWFYNVGKRSVTIDLGGVDGQRQFHELLRTADVFVHDVHPAGAESLSVGGAELLARYPAIIVCAITPFGQDGPWAGYAASDLVALAAGGPLISCGYDDLTIPPIRPGGNQGYHVGASFAYNAVLLALIQRQHTGLGQVIDTSLHSALAVTVELSNPYWMYTRTLVRRQTGRGVSVVPTQPATLRCGDGRYVYFVLMTAEQKPWEALVSWMETYGLAVDLVEARYNDSAYRREQYAHIHEIVETFASLLDSATFFHEGQARQLPIGIIYAPEDLLTDPHLEERGFFVTIDGRQGPVTYPGAPYRFSGLAWRIERPAPRLGEHNDLVLRP